MTDNEIIMALVYCSKQSLISECEKCEVSKGCRPYLISKALDLIFRQKADIKNLTSGKCIYLSDDETTEYCVEGPCPNYKTEAQIKTEAIKEFAERLKQVFYNDEFIFTRNIIDNLVKETVGDNDG